MRSRVGILLSLAVVAAGLSQMQAIVRVEERLGLGWLYGVRGAVEPPTGAAIIGLDEDTTAWLQRNGARLADTAPNLHGCLDEKAEARLKAMRSASDLPRDVFACLIDALAAQHPRLLIFDVYFIVAQKQDAMLADAIRRAGNVLLLERVTGEAPEPEPGPALLMRHRPVGVLEAAALGTVGFLVERAPGQVTTRYLTRIGAFPDLKVMPIEAQRLTGGAVPPLPEREAFWLYGPPRTVPTWSLREVFEPRNGHPLELRGRVVFIGGSSLGPEDFALTAFPSRPSLRR